MRRSGLYLACAILALARPNPAELEAETPSRFALSADAVAATLAEEGLVVSPAQVQLPLPLTATNATPAMRVTAAELLPDGRMQLRVACRDPKACLPFHVIVDLHGRAAALAGIAGLHSSSDSASQLPRSEDAALRAGAHATLLIEDRHMRIQLPVISMDSGAAGSEIRVSSLDRKTIYRGVVVDRGLVRGSLQ